MLLFTCFFSDPRVLPQPVSTEEAPQAASIGVVGIFMFTFILGSVLVIDILTSTRDFIILKDNLYDGWIRIMELSSKVYRYRYRTSFTNI